MGAAIDSLVHRLVKVHGFTAAAGGGSAKTAWETEVSDTSAATLTMSGIGTFEELVLWVWVTDDGANNFVPALRFNSDTGANYGYANGDASAEGASASDNVIRIARQGTLNGSSVVVKMNIHNTAQTEFGSDISFVHQGFRQGTTLGWSGGGRWANAGPITTIQLLDDSGSSNSFASARMAARRITL